MNAQRPVRVLLVEDNVADVVLVREALHDAGLPYSLTVATDGREALRNLREMEPSSAPEMIVLDLNLPIMTGQEVLKKLDEDPTLPSVPVAVLTSSPYDQAICSELCRVRCGYFVKPAAYRELVRVVTEIERFRRQETAEGNEVA